LVRALRKAYRVDFFALTRQYPELLFPGATQYDDSQNPIVEAHIACIDSINPWTWLKSAWRIKKAAPDLVVIQWWHPFFALSFGAIANLLAVISKTKVCFLCHNVLPHESTIFDRLLLTYAFWQTNHFIVHSEEDEKNLRQLKPKATIKRNIHPSYSIFGDFQSYSKEEARRKLGLDLEDRIVLFFGLVRKYKGLQYLIQAMPDVVAAMDCTLLIAGEFYDAKSDYLELIEAYIEIQTANGNVRLPGSGNLPVSAVIGNTDCTVGSFAPCLIGPDMGGGLGSVTFEVEGYNPDFEDLT